VRNGSVARRVLVSPAFHALAFIVVFGAVLGWWLSEIGGLSGIRDRFGFFAALVIVPIHAVIAISPLPSEVLAFGNAVAFGFWPGAALSWVGWMAGSLVHYGLMRRVADDIDLAPHLGRLPRWLRRFPVDHPAFLICGHWLPYGPQLMSTIGGAFKVPLFRFAWCQGVAITPIALLYAALAKGLVG